MPPARINFLDLNFDQLSFDEVKQRLQLVNTTTPYGYVVTPNVQHVVEVHRDPSLREIYDAATYCVCDSRILRVLARLRRLRVPLVAGSDLVEALFTGIISPGDTVAVVGGTEASIERLQRRFPDFDFRHFAPPMGLRHDLQARRSAAAFIAAANARFTLIAVGMPQQEMIASETRKLPGACGMAFCIGAGLEFVTGEQRRAPPLVQRLHLEWAHRLASNPRRLWRRYLVEGLKIFPIFLDWNPGSRSHRPSNREESRDGP